MKINDSCRFLAGRITTHKRGYGSKYAHVLIPVPQGYRRESKRPKSSRLKPS
jgi:hypothetical protein